MVIKYNDLTEENQNLLMQIMIDTSKVESDKSNLIEKMKELGIALYYNISPEKINDPNYSSSKIREIRLYEKDGFDSTLYSAYDAKKMYEIRLGLKRELDMTPVLEYTAEQIEQINNRYEELANSTESTITLNDVLMDLGLVEKVIEEPVLEKLPEQTVEEVPAAEEIAKEIIEETAEVIVEEVIESEIKEEYDFSNATANPYIEQQPQVEEILPDDNEIVQEEPNLTLDEKIEINTEEDIFAVDNDIPDELKKLFDFEI